MIFSKENPWYEKKLLSIDYGEKFTGLAKFHIGRDPFPHPYGRLVETNQPSLFHLLRKVVEEEEIDTIILGVPTLLDGQETTMTKKVRQFGCALTEYFHPIPVHLQDETLSTFEAKERMKNSPRYNFKICLEEVDALAATIILEDFLTSL